MAWPCTDPTCQDPDTRQPRPATHRVTLVERIGASTRTRHYNRCLWHRDELMVWITSHRDMSEDTGKVVSLSSNKV